MPSAYYLPMYVEMASCWAAGDAVGEVLDDKTYYSATARHNDIACIRRILRSILGKCARLSSGQAYYLGLD